MRSIFGKIGLVLVAFALLIPAGSYAGMDSSSIVVTINAAQSSTADFATPRADLTRQYALQLATGTGADQADRIYHKQRTITASSNDDLDLAGVLTDAFGSTLTFVKVKAIIIVASSSNANNLVIGNAAATQFVGPFGAAANTLTLGPGDMFVVTRRGSSGLAVGAGSSDILRITNGGGGTSVVYDIFVLGTSA